MLAQVLNAKSVAIVGASKNVTKRGYQTIRTLVEEHYEGEIYPVNPKEKRILGFDCFPKVSAIPGPVDMALLAVPAKIVAQVLEDCGKKGVKGAVVLANGFGETGDEGRRLEAAVVAKARENGIRIVGPNTSGMMNLKDNLNLVGLRDAPRGDIALLTQSGNMALTLITEAKLKSLKGFSYYVGVGNEADVRFHEYLAFFREDPGTKAILMYIEGLRQGREFLQQAYDTTQEKPIILLKSGRSATGKRSAGSHTGALAGMSEVANSALKRAGIIMVENPDELFPAAETLSSLPPIRNGNIAILADGGGHATIAADLLTDLGVGMPAFSERTQAQLKQILPAAASVVNPVDVAGGTDDNPAIFAACADIILKDPNVGGLLIVGLFGGYGIRFDESLALIEEDAAHQMGKMVQQRHKPIVLHSLYSSEKPHALHLLRYYGVPVYDSLNVACKCIGVLAEYGAYLKSYHAKANYFYLDWGKRATDAGRAVIQQVRGEKRRALLEPEAKQLIELDRGSTSRDRLADSPDAAVAAAREISGKVALKIVSPDILHKSDAGGVRINLETEEEIRGAFAGIMANASKFNAEADIRGVLVSPMAPPGVEVIIGTKMDDQFGPVIMVGLGGVLVEVLRDVAFRVLPISPRMARQMIAETKSHHLLKGVRGAGPSDEKALVKLLTQCSDLIQAYPEIQEMDLNPVIVHPEGRGVSVVDARIILKTEAVIRAEQEQRIRRAGGKS